MTGHLPDFLCAGRRGQADVHGCGTWSCPPALGWWQWTVRTANWGMCRTTADQSTQPSVSVQTHFRNTEESPLKEKWSRDHQKRFLTTYICLEIAKTQGKISMAHWQGYFNEFGLSRIWSNREFVFRNVLRAVKQSSRISSNKELVFRTCPKGSEQVKQNFI